MAKTKSPTPQEIYKARKQREEDEREAYLPPGFVNHGNTCFMNSVLQGLLATPLLVDIVTTPTVTRRSPQLTNGHGLGGQYEKKWEEGMPIGDVFVGVMRKAWDAQQHRRRDSMSPKVILNTLGKKYDQYLDFAQQDAHEFLRQLLDAMRMEEFDVIKKRQPPNRLRRRDTLMPGDLTTPEPHTMTDEDNSTEPNLVSFADMLFGGKLTSILVCQKCKHVSQTYEDFNDLSLSIRPDDHHRDRKRNRFKNLAKKFKLGSSSSSSSSTTTFAATAPTTAATSTTSINVNDNLAVGSLLQQHRASSVPPSPRCDREDIQLGGDPPVNDDPRRRSFDGVADAIGVSAIQKRDPSLSDAEGGDFVDVERPPPPPSLADEEPVMVIATPIPVPVRLPSSPRVEFAEPNKKDKDKEKDSSKKSQDGWGRISRRLSLSKAMGIGRSSTPKDRRSSHSHDRPSSPVLKPSAASSSRTSVSSDIVLVDTPTPITPTTAFSPVASPTPTYTAAVLKSRPPSASPSKSLQSLPTLAKLHHHREQRSKSPRPPKPSAAETEYIRQILADITPSAGSSSGSHNPFALFMPSSSTDPPSNISSGSGSGTTGSRTTDQWLKLTQFTGIEECLRMFTSVERLDGENMVGCRRCWKIANGVYVPPNDTITTRTRTGKEEGSESDDNDARNVHESSRTEKPVRPGIRVVPSSSSNSTGGASVNSSMSTPTLPLYRHSNKSGDDISLSTFTTFGSESQVTLSGATRSSGTNTDSDTSLDEEYDNVDVAGSLSFEERRGSTPGGLPIPVISTTAPPESPVDGIVHQDDTGLVDAASIRLPPSPPLPHSTPSFEVTRNSLQAPRLNHRPHQQLEYKTSISSDDADDDDDSSEEECGLDSDTPSRPRRTALTPAQKALRAKQVLPRPAYKRYLISTPPPILVIHLKRFQQHQSKLSTLSFSSGFRKLEDYVAFPEVLDLGAFLAPRKEDFGLGRSRRRRRKEKGKKGGGGEEVLNEKEKEHHRERCLYRLYAVVVHIGNMLGGHYIAYTALPPRQTDDPSSTPTSSSSSSSSPPPPRQWAYISDTVVRLTTLEEVLKAKAYICMYERI